MATENSVQKARAGGWEPSSSAKSGARMKSR